MLYSNHFSLILICMHYLSICKYNNYPIVQYNTLYDTKLNYIVRI